MTVSGSQIITAAEQYTGVPYSQVNPQNPSGSGLDCSGLVQLALSNLGVSIPRTTSTQLAAAMSGQVGQDIGTNLANAQPGDIIHYAGHEEIWLGNGQVFSEATYGTKAAVRAPDPAAIIGIVRYTGVPSSGISLASSTSGGSSSSLDWISEAENWVQGTAMRVGLIVFGAILILSGLIIAFKDTGAAKAAVKTVKAAAVIGA
jgi:hypothetical protein